MRAFRQNQRRQLVKEYQDQKAGVRTEDDPQLLAVSSRVGTPDNATGSSRTPENPIIPWREPEESNGKPGEVLSLEIGSCVALDPLSSTALYSHHDAPRLFLRCTPDSL